MQLMRCRINQNWRSVVNFDLPFFKIWLQLFYFFVYNPAEKESFIDQINKLADSMPNINILYGKVLADFKSFVKYILPATPEKTDQEQAIELLQKALVNNADT